MMAFCEAWLEQHPEDTIQFWVSERAKGWSGDRRIEFKYLPHFYFKRFHPASYLKLLALVGKAFGWLRQERPDGLVGAGGIHTFALILASWFKKVPIIIHEQNCHLGLANRAALPFVTRVAVSFQSTLKHVPHKKGVWTSNLLRRSLRQAHRKASVQSPMNVLVIGGSQGAEFLNRLVINAVRKMSRDERNLFSWIHLTGAQEYDAMKSDWHTLECRSEVHPFFEAMEKLYTKSDVVVGRAGAGTLFEIAHFALPSILIPYPFAKAHQMDNALAFKEKEACLVFEQSEMTAELLKNTLLLLQKDQNLRDHLGAQVATLSKSDALEMFVHEVENMTKKSSHDVCCAH